MLLIKCFWKVGQAEQEQSTLLFQKNSVHIWNYSETALSTLKFRGNVNLSYLSNAGKLYSSPSAFLSYCRLKTHWMLKFFFT